MFRKFPFGRRPLNLVLAGAIATSNDQNLWMALGGVT